MDLNKIINENEKSESKVESNELIFQILANKGISTSTSIPNFEHDLSNKSSCQNPNQLDRNPIEPKIKFCRICLENDEKETEKLLSPCNCQGSMKHIHNKCLRNWILIRFPNFVEKGASCEICKIFFKIRFVSNWNISKSCFFIVLKETFIFFLIVIIPFSGILAGIYFIITSQLNLTGLEKIYLIISLGIFFLLVLGFIVNKVVKNINKSISIESKSWEICNVNE